MNKLTYEINAGKSVDTKGKDIIFFIKPDLRIISILENDNSPIKVQDLYSDTKMFWKDDNTISLIALPFPYQAEFYIKGNTPTYDIQVINGWTLLDPFNRLVKSIWTETDLTPYEIKQSAMMR